MSLGRNELYEVRTIAVGGMARLTLATTADGHQVVLRELHRKYALRVKTRWLFIRGTRMRRALCPHPHLVCPISACHACIVPYEVIEYVDGENLRELIMHRRASVKTHALEILRQLAQGLAYMHEKHIVHLDVKPENIMVDLKPGHDGLAVKLTDFDLARNVRTGGRLRAGTASHMAPEQLTGGKVSFANDIFAFGVIAYYLVAGKMPFSGFSLKEVRRQQVSSKYEVPEPRRFNPELAPKLNWIILRCLEKDQKRRFPNMSYLLQELGRV